ncbi:MAG: hybrid-cluster NAD(P)-dependent oxidoreductase [Rhodoferax sp.]
MEPVAIRDRLMQPETWERFGREWPSSEERRLLCCRVTAETHDVKTFVFRTEDGSPIRFEPGQYVTITVAVNDQLVSRCYTISSPPTRPYTFSITVKRVPGGLVSNWLHDHLQQGVAIRASGPAGDFTPTAHPAEKLLYLSAGSGITPLMSMTRSSVDLGEDLDIVFVHSARSPADIVFRQELSALSRSCSRLRVVYLCESIGDERDWSGPVGRLTLERLQQFVPDFLERELFVCGPEGYMRGAQVLLTEACHPPNRYHQESFNIAAAPATEVPAAATAVQGADGLKTYTVRLAKSKKSFTVDASLTLLSAVKKAGTAIASSCQQGICGSCKTAVLEGTVEMRHQGGIRQREVDKGLRLLCCSYASSDVVLDI